MTDARPGLSDTPADIARRDPRWRRLQFLLGPARSRIADGWRTTDVAGGSVVESHPDLPVTQVPWADGELTLLGFIVDPDAPERGDDAVLRDLAIAADDEALAERTVPMGGRWVLIVARDGRVRTFADPSGLRAIHHAEAGGERWCASSASFLAERLGLPVDPSAAEFASSSAFRSYAEPWWPGTTSLFQGASRLLPNHRLDLGTGAVERIWPSGLVEDSRAHDPVATCADTLRGLMQAAALRHPLALGLTAGIDSRSLLAASRDIREQMGYYTFDTGASADHRRDVRTAGAVLDRLGLAQVVLPTRDDPVEPFRSLYRLSTDTAHDYCARFALALASGLPSGRLFVLGNCSEIGRRFYRNHYAAVPMTAEGLASLVYLERSQFAVQAIGRWLEEAAPVADRTDHDILDLLVWEIKHGSWLAAGQAEWDIVVDTFTPYDCRRLIDTMLAVDPAERAAPDYRFHRRLIEAMWPEALSVPINPESIRMRLTSRAKSVAGTTLRRTGTYGPVKATYLRLRRVRTPKTH